VDKEVFVKFWKSGSGFQIWTPDTDCVRFGRDLRPLCALLQFMQHLLICLTM